MYFPKSLIDGNLPSRIQEVLSLGLDSQDGDNPRPPRLRQSVDGTRSARATVFLIGLLLVSLHSVPGVASAQNSTIFGPNVYVFTPSDSASSINTTLNTLNANTQFSTNRYAVLFEPGTYTGVEAEVGYYESVAGLGETPNAVTINNGYLTSNQTDSNGNLTTNFWRSIENMYITPLRRCAAMGRLAGRRLPAHVRQRANGTDEYQLRGGQRRIHGRYRGQRKRQCLLPAAVVHAQ